MHLDTLRCTNIQSAVLIIKRWVTEPKDRKRHDKIIPFLIEFQISFATNICTNCMFQDSTNEQMIQLAREYASK